MNTQSRKNMVGNFVAFLLTFAPPLPCLVHKVPRKQQPNTSSLPVTGGRRADPICNGLTCLPEGLISLSESELRQRKPAQLWSQAVESCESGKDDAGKLQSWAGWGGRLGERRATVLQMPGARDCGWRNTIEFLRLWEAGWHSLGN